MPTAPSECYRCGESGEFQMSSCLICQKGVCYRCSLSVSGRSFCSQACADYFFHGDDDETKEEP